MTWAHSLWQILEVSHLRQPPVLPSLVRVRPSYVAVRQNFIEDAGECSPVVQNVRSGRPFFDGWQPHAHAHTRSSYGVLSQPWMSPLPFRYLALRLRLRLRPFGLTLSSGRFGIHRSDASSNELVREMTTSQTELAPLHLSLTVRAENSGDQVHSCLRERANPIMNSMKSNLRRVRGPVFMPATPVADVTLPGPFWCEPACDLSAYTG